MIMLLLWAMVIIMLIIVLSLVIIPLLILRFLFSAFALLLFIPLFSLMMYWYWGGASQIQSWVTQQQQQVQTQALIAQFKSPSEVIEALKSRLKQDPSSAKGWYLLAKLYMDQHDYAEAVKALEKANKLDHNKPEIMLALAQALFFENNRLLDPKAKALLNSVLKVEPNNIDALNLLAIDAYNSGYYQKAINYWQELLPLLTEGSEEQSLVIDMLAKAQKKKKGSSLDSTA